MIFLTRRLLDATAHIHAVGLNNLDRFLDILRGKPSSQKHARSLGHLCCKLPVDDLSSASIGLIGKGVQHKPSYTGPPTKLCQSEKCAPIFHAQRFEDCTT